jgi:PTS system mannose-specific IIB component/fructoselysine and glucoselysine-specific PTS system IIB component
MHALLKGVGNIGHVNVGGLHHRPGRTQKLRYVFLSPEEEREMRDLIAAGVKVTAQDVPAARPVPMEEVLGLSADAEKSA